MFESVTQDLGAVCFMRGSFCKIQARRAVDMYKRA